MIDWWWVFWEKGHFCKGSKVRNANKQHFLDPLGICLRTPDTTTHHQASHFHYSNWWYRDDAPHTSKQRKGRPNHSCGNPRYSLPLTKALTKYAEHSKTYEHWIASPQMAELINHLALSHWTQAVAVISHTRDKSLQRMRYQLPPCTRECIGNRKPSHFCNNASSTLFYLFIDLLIDTTVQILVTHSSLKDMYQSALCKTKSQRQEFYCNFLYEIIEYYLLKSSNINTGQPPQIDWGTGHVLEKNQDSSTHSLNQHILSHKYSCSACSS